MINKNAPLLPEEVINRARKLSVALILDGVKKAKLDIPRDGCMYAEMKPIGTTRLEFYIFETSVFSHIRVAGLLRLLDFFKCLCDILNKILCIFQSTAHADQVWCNATGNQFFLG